MRCQLGDPEGGIRPIDGAKRGRQIDAAANAHRCRAAGLRASVRQRQKCQTLKGSEIPYLRRKVGTVFQDFQLLEKKSVFDNVALPLLVQGVSQADIKRKVTEALRAVGVEHKRDQLPMSLSTGEQQRVCIARAIVNGPVVLLADEPTGNLDPALTGEIIELFKLINARGTTVVVATHDPVSDGPSESPGRNARPRLPDA